MRIKAVLIALVLTVALVAPVAVQALEIVPPTMEGSVEQLDQDGFVEHAQSAEDRLAMAFTDFRYQVASCIAFYSLFQGGVERRTDSPEKQAAQKAITQGLKSLGAIAGAVYENKLDLYAAHLKLVYQRLHDEMRGDYSNIGILMAKYGSGCRAVVENAKSVFAEIMQQYGLDSR